MKQNKIRVSVEKYIDKGRERLKAQCLISSFRWRWLLDRSDICRYHPCSMAVAWPHFTLRFHWTCWHAAAYIRGRTNSSRLVLGILRSATQIMWVFFLSLGELMREGWRMMGGGEIGMCGWGKMGLMRGAAYSHNVCAASLFLFF